MTIPVDTLSGLLTNLDVLNPLDGLKKLICADADKIPFPARGDTFHRWQILSAVASHDLGLAKLFESHTDALAIMDELKAAVPAAGSVWGVWCAEPPDFRIEMSQSSDGKLVLNGRKAWCSGASGITHALVSCWNKDGQSCLAAVELAQDGIDITTEGWQAVGMASTQSVRVNFRNVTAVLIGAPNSYVERPGFWHGGAGIAACWYGACVSLANRLHVSLRSQNKPGASPTLYDPHRLAQLGNIDVALSTVSTLLHDVAKDFDRHPLNDGMELAMRVRLAVESAANEVLRNSTRALGAGPLCQELKFAKMAADLPVFLRQSHAERDLANLGKIIANKRTEQWAL